MPPPRRAIYGKISKVVYLANKGPDVVGIDSERLLSRMLLFDEVVVDSTNLGELPYLAKMFGVDGLEQLLHSGVIKLVSQKSCVVTDVKLNNKRQLPLLQFGQGIATSEDNDHNLGMKMKSLLRIGGLSNARRADLESLLRSKLIKPSPSYGTDLLAQIRKDLTSNVTLVRQLLCHRNPSISDDKLSLTVHAVGETQKFESNLQDIMKISPEGEHNIFSDLITGLSNLNQRLADIYEYSAISHFEESEAPLLFGKVFSVIAPHNPAINERAFLRIIEVTEIPNLIISGRISVDKLLKARATDECREFGSWLSTTDHINDADLKRLVAGFRAKAASFMSSGPGKTLRLAVNTALGLVPGYGTATALAEGMVDTFLLDKMLPSSGVLTFLNRRMPSIFTSASEL